MKSATVPPWNLGGWRESLPDLPSQLAVFSRGKGSVLLNEPTVPGDAGHTRVVAPDYASAVRILQDRFGSDWTVVHSRKVRRPGFLGLFGVSDVVVIVRTEEAMLFQPQANPVVSSSGKLAPLARELGEIDVPVSIPDLVPVTAGNFEPSNGAGDLVYRLEGARSRIAEELKAYSNSLAGDSATAPWDPAPPRTDEESPIEIVRPGVAMQMKTESAAFLDGMAEPIELASTEKLIGNNIEQSEGTDVDPAFLGAVLTHCDVAGFPPAAQKTIVQQVCADPIDESLGPEDYQQIARERIVRCIKKRIPDTMQIAGGSVGQPKVVALVGPTGVGKTTTLAKLAAHFHLVEKRRVGLVTLDCYRIGAIEQLRRFAEILGLPLKTVSETAGAAEAIEGFSDCDVILVDTAGRSQRDQERLIEVRDSLANIGDVEIHLCLSLAASPEAIVAAAESFRMVKYDRVIFTKQDESYRKGFLWDLFGVTPVPVSYVTCGQEVPEDIQAATRDLICDMMIQGR